MQEGSLSDRNQYNQEKATGKKLSNEFSTSKVKQMNYKKVQDSHNISKPILII